MVNKYMQVYDLLDKLSGALDDLEVMHHDWIEYARMEAKVDQMEAMLEELGIPEHLSVGQLLDIKAAIAAIVR